MTFSAGRKFLALLLLCLTAPAGLWFGEGMFPLTATAPSATLLLLAFGATLVAPSPHRREKYYVLIAATVLFVGAWVMGHDRVTEAIADCLAGGSVLQDHLEAHYAAHGQFPEQLSELAVKLPGERLLHPPLLAYQVLPDDYRLFFRTNRVHFEASRYTPFLAHRRPTP